MIAVLDPAEVAALEESIRQTDVIHSHSDRWQDAYQSAMALAESGVDQSWVKSAKALEVLAQIGPQLLSGCPVQLGKARDLILREMQAWAECHADEIA